MLEAPRRHLCRLLPLLAWAWSAPILAQDAVLTPDSGALLEAAFATIEPVAHLERAAIQAAQVQARVCAGQVCRDLVLRAPDDACAGLALPAFCVAGAEALPEPARAALARALEGLEPTRVWHRPAMGRAQVERGPPLDAWLRLAAVLLAPLLLVLGVRLGWRRWRRHSA